jgi:hypothetical protein
MYIDQLVLNWIAITLISLCWGMIGYYYSNRKTDEVIDDTIVYLCENGFIYHYKTKNGEIEILTLEAGGKNGQESDFEEKT